MRKVFFGIESESDSIESNDRNCFLTTLEKGNILVFPNFTSTYYWYSPACCPGRYEPIQRLILGCEPHSYINDVCTLNFTDNWRWSSLRQWLVDFQEGVGFFCLIKYFLT